MSRPPRLPDSDIQSVIAELRPKHAILTGTILRAELCRRFGMPGGVSRIYRLLRAANAPAATGNAPPPAPFANADLSRDVTELRAQLRQALERAELAEHREEHHQARWAVEIHQLREQVHALREAAHRLPVLEREVQDRSRELAAAYRHIADLEARLRQP